MGAEKNARLLLNEILSEKIEYLAFLEGDDFWLKRDKLQKQYTFLSDNPNYQLVCSNISIQNSDGVFLRNRFDFSQDNIDFNFKYILKKNHISTCSVMIRTYQISQHPIPKVHFRDKYFWFRLLTTGDCRYINDVTASYTLHDGGSYTNLLYYEKSIKRAKDYWVYSKLFPEYKQDFILSMVWLYLKAFVAALKRFEISGFFLVIKKA